jgi:hypothetical protein
VRQVINQLKFAHFVTVDPHITLTYLSTYGKEVKILAEVDIPGREGIAKICFSRDVSGKETIASNLTPSEHSLIFTLAPDENGNQQVLRVLNKLCKLLSTLNG